MIKLLILWIRSFKVRSSHVPGTSMLETVVSMSILLSILTLSFATLNRVNHSFNPAAQYKAHLVCKEILCRDDLLVDEIDAYEIEGYTVNKTLFSLGNESYRVELSVKNGFGKIIYKRKTIKSNEIIL